MKLELPTRAKLNLPQMVIPCVKFDGWLTDSGRSFNPDPKVPLS